MILNLGGEDVTVLTPSSRVVRTVAPLAPRPTGEALLAVDNAGEAGWVLYLPSGDPITRGAKVLVRSVSHVVEGQPADWGHCVIAQVYRLGQDAVVTLRRPSTADWDDDEQATVVTDGDAYATDIPARIQSRSSRSVTHDTDTAEETLPIAPYVVEIDLEVDAHEGDTVHVSAADDASLIGRVLHVDQVVRGGDNATRELLCSLAALPSTP